MSDETPTLADVLLAIAALRSDLMARLDRHEDRLTAIREDIGVNFGRADRAVDAVKSVRTELDHLSTEVAAITRQMRRMQTELREIKGEP